MNIQIKTDDLERDIAKLKQVLGDLKDTKEGMYQCIERLNSMWEGNANRMFIAQTSVDKIKFQSLLKNIEHFIECINYAKSQYANCEEDIDSKIKAIKVSGDS